MKTLDQVLSANPNAGLGDLVTEQLVSVSDRIGNLERTIAGDLKGLIERAMSSQGPGGGVMQTVLNDRFQSLRQTLDQQSLSVTSAIAQLTEPVLDRLRQVEQGVERRHGESAQVWRTLADRLAQIEANGQASDARARDILDIKEALVQLGDNQQALANGLQDWRVDAEGGLTIVSNRLELLERASAHPVEILQQMQTDLQGLQQVTLADYDHNRRGFKHWLFGTDDVFAGSWRDETAQVRERLRRMREQRQA
jgi:hypothetical protein